MADDLGHILAEMEAYEKYAPKNKTTKEKGPKTTHQIVTKTEELVIQNEYKPIKLQQTVHDIDYRAKLWENTEHYQNVGDNEELFDNLGSVAPQRYYTENVTESVENSGDGNENVASSIVSVVAHKEMQKQDNEFLMIDDPTDEPSDVIIQDRPCYTQQIDRCVAPREYMEELDDEMRSKQTESSVESMVITENRPYTRYHNQVVSERCVVPKEYAKKSVRGSVECMVTTESTPYTRYHNEVVSERCVAPKEYAKESMPSKQLVSRVESTVTTRSRPYIRYHNEVVSERCVAPKEYAKESMPSKQLKSSVEYMVTTESRPYTRYHNEVLSQRCVAPKVYYESDNAVESADEVRPTLTPDRAVCETIVYEPRMMSSSVVEPMRMEVKAVRTLPVCDEQQCQTVSEASYDEVNVIDSRKKLDYLCRNIADSDDPRTKLLASVYDLDVTYHLYSFNVDLDSRLEFARSLLDNGIIADLIQIVKETLRTTRLDQWTGRWTASLNSLQIVITADDFMSAFNILFNLSDPSPGVAGQICDDKALMRQIVEKITFYHKNSRCINPDAMKKATSFIGHALGLLHNCASFDANREAMRALCLSPLFFSIIDHSKVEDHRLSAVLGLVDILTEEENKQLVANSEGIEFLMSHLDAAVKDRRLMSLGWSAKELAEAVSKLALNEENTKVLLDRGVLVTLWDMLKRGSNTDIKAAVNALWALSFNKATKERMLQEEDLIVHLEKLLMGSPDTIKKDVERIMWNLRYILCSSERFNKLGAQFCRIEGSGESTKKHHIMLSYNWTHQDLMLRVRDTLRARGYRVWMDVEKMTGSTIGCMAAAIEGCAAIVFGMTEKYRDSKFCRHELEYAFLRKKLLIPLKFQNKYEADGWLGFVTVSLKYFNVADPKRFDGEMAGVLKALGSPASLGVAIDDDGDGGVGRDYPPLPVEENIARKTVTKISTLPPPDVNKPRPTETLVGTDVKSWTNEQVSQWFRSHSITTVRHDVTGKHLVFLLKVKMEAPEYFYRLVETQLGLMTLNDLMSFHEAFATLFLW